MLVVKQKGDFSKVNSYFQKLLSIPKMSILDTYGRMGVSRLSAATPVDTGETANSWSYVIERTKEGASLIFCNSHVNMGANVAVLIQYGHGTRQGAWVEGIDYINPALRPVFEEIAKDIWKEVTNV